MARARFPDSASLICGLNFLLVLDHAPRDFSSDTPVFPSFQFKADKFFWRLCEFSKSFYDLLKKLREPFPGGHAFKQ